MDKVSFLNIMEGKLYDQSLSLGVYFVSRGKVHQNTSLIKE